MQSVNQDFNGLAALSRGRECTTGAARTIHSGGPALAGFDAAVKEP
jgi:hypothetical protein